jgi:hypothetical protein
VDQASSGVGEGEGADFFFDCPTAISAQMQTTLATTKIRGFMLVSPPGQKLDGNVG